MVIIKEGDPSKVPNLKFECTVSQDEYAKWKAEKEGNK